MHLLFIAFSKSPNVNLVNSQHRTWGAAAHNFYVYAGELSFGKTNEYGIIKSKSGNAYEGTFKDNKKHSWGVYRMVPNRRNWHQDLFNEGTYLGNPHQKKLSTKDRIMGFLQVKMMRSFKKLFHNPASF
jgi:hypothetical protein